MMTCRNFFIFMLVLVGAVQLTLPLLLCANFWHTIFRDFQRFTNYNEAEFMFPGFHIREGVTLMIPEFS